MIEELIAGVDKFGLLFWFCLFFAKGYMFLDSDEVCSVAVLLTVCTVFMWKRLCICSGWGTETRAGMVQLISSLQCCIFSCQFFSTCWKFLVSCFKIASRERGSIPYRDSWAKWQINFPWLCSFSSSLPWWWLCWSCGSPGYVSLCTSPDEQHCVHHGLHTAILTDIILPVWLFLNSKAAFYRPIFFFFSWEITSTAFLPEQGYGYGRALDNSSKTTRTGWSAPFPGIIDAGRISWQRKQTATTIPECSCDLAFAMVGNSFKKKIFRKKMTKVTFMCNLKYPGFYPRSLKVKDCCVNPSSLSLAKSGNPGS